MKLSVRAVCGLVFALSAASVAWPSSNPLHNAAPTGEEPEAFLYAQEVAQLKADMERLKEELQTLKACEKHGGIPLSEDPPTTTGPAMAQSSGRLMSSEIEATTQTQNQHPDSGCVGPPSNPIQCFTPNRILTPNRQGYWLRLKQPGTATTWSFASEPWAGTLRFGSDSAPGFEQLRIDADGAMTTGSLSLNATGDPTPDLGSQPPSSRLTFHASAWDPYANAPVDVTSAFRLGTHNGDTYYGTTTEFLDSEGYPWLWFLDFEGDRPGHELYFESDEPGPMLFNLKNHAPGQSLFIRFYAGDVEDGLLGQWLLGIEGGSEQDPDIPGDFSLIRDWYWTALKVEQEDGRILIDQLDSHPAANPRAEARLHVRGLLDETQFMVDAGSSQTGDILQIRDSSGTNYLAVRNTGDTAVGDPAQPKALVLYDVADGTAHYLQVRNGQLELVRP